MPIFIFIVIHWYSSLFFQTFFMHRYAAHGMFTMSKFWEKIFYIGAFITQGSSFLSPRAYGIMHRMHHVYADTEKDPHSPKYDDNLFKMMWKTKNTFNAIFKDKMTIDERFMKNLPDWFVFEKITNLWFVRTAWGLFYVAVYIYFDPAWWVYLFLPVNILMSPFHGAVINWFAHKYGYVSHKVGDTSKNLLPFDFLMLGESYHNNHHKFGSRANFGIKWHEFDPVYPFILLFDKLGIIRLKRNVDPLKPF